MSLVIWKYPFQNYFEGPIITMVDKIAFEKLPIRAFPVFDLSTEEIFSIAQYKPGEFAIELLIDSGESSFVGKSIYNFFMEQPRKNKFLIGFRIGNTKQWGTFTNQNVDFGYSKRSCQIMVRHIQNEAIEQITKFFTGTLDHSRTLENFITQVFMPGGVYRLDAFTKFNTYGGLIGDPLTYVRYEIQSGAEWGPPVWVNTLDCWSQWTQLLTGCGLNWDMDSLAEPNIAYDFINFKLNAFSLEQIPHSGIDITGAIEGEATETTLFNQLEYLFMPNRRYALNDLVDGVYGIISNGTTTYSADRFHSTGPGAGGYFGDWINPGFLQDKRSGEFKNNIDYIGTWPIPDPFYTQRFNLDKDTRMIELPMYRYTYPFQGDGGIIPNMAELGEKISYSRIVCDSADNGFGCKKVQEYAMKQLKRYTGFSKRNFRLRHHFTASDIPQLWQRVNLVEGARSSEFYVSRIQNIDYSKMECELTLIEY